MPCTGQVIQIPYAPLYSETEGCREVIGQKFKEAQVYIINGTLYINKADLPFGKFYITAKELPQEYDCNGKKKKIQELVWSEEYTDEKTSTKYLIKQIGAVNPYTTFNNWIIAIISVILVFAITGVIVATIIFIKNLNDTKLNEFVNN